MLKTISITVAISLVCAVVSYFAGRQDGLATGLKNQVAIDHYVDTTVEKDERGNTTTIGNYKRSSRSAIAFPFDITDATFLAKDAALPDGLWSQSPRTEGGTCDIKVTAGMSSALMTINGTNVVVSLKKDGNFGLIVSGKSEDCILDIPIEVITFDRAEALIRVEPGISHSTGHFFYQPSDRY